LDTDILVKNYDSGEIIVTEGKSGDCMYVIQKGTVEVYQTLNGKEVHLAKLKEGDFFGEMAIFEKEIRSASARALDPVQILMVDKKNFLDRIEENPSLAFNIVRKMSNRIRAMDQKISKIKSTDRRDWQTRPSNIKGPGHNKN